MRLRTYVVCLLAIVFLVGGALAQNNSIPHPTTSNPDVGFTHSLDSNPYGLATYDANQQVFSLTAVTDFVIFPPKVFTCKDLNICPAPVITMAVQVDHNGNLTGGNPNPNLPDLEVDGQVTNGQTTYTSPLLIGKVTEFYYDGVNNTPNFRLRFAVTGGSMASLYLNNSLNNDLWMILTLEDMKDQVQYPRFNGSFLKNFYGQSKGDIVGTPGKCYGKIGDYVWNDLNGDGIQDSVEPGMDGITVNLYDSNNVKIATDVTHLGPTGSIHGYYQFTGVCAGNYKVQVDEATLPPHFEATTVNAPGSTTENDSNPNPSPVTLTNNASVDETIDFGYIAMQGSLGDYVWYDQNHNGVQDANEHGINGVVVRLYDSSHNFLAVTTTAFGGPNNVDGYYQFTGLDEGDYIVEVDSSTLPANYSPTTPFVGDSAHDSNGSPATANLPTDSSSDQTIDFGYVTPCNGKIGDFVWHDLDRNGLQDIGEPGIDGVHLLLYDSAHNQVGMAITNPNGYYLFDGVCDGTYEVDVDAGTLPPNFTATTPHVGGDTTIDSNGSPAPVTLTLDGNNNVTQDLTIDFGYVSPCNGAIGDFVWLDLNGNGIQDAGEAGIFNVTVNLRDAQNHLLNSTQTDSTGYYQFTGLCAATYFVEVVPPVGYAASPTGQTTPDKDSNPNPSTVVLSVINQNGDVTNDETIDFGFVPGRIIIKKLTDPSGSQQSFTFTPSYNNGATFQLSDGQSNDSGPLAAGQYSVMESVPQNWVQTSATCDNNNTPDAISLAAGQTVVCTFKNTQNGNIIVNKVTVPAGSTQSFTFTTTGTGYNGFSLTGANGSNSNDSGPLAPGLYSVAEAALSGWDLTSATCDHGQSIGAINLAAGQTVTCTFTNTQRATLIVVKNTIGGDDTFSFVGGGNGVAANFTLTTSGGTASTTFNNLTPGPGYSVSETVPSAWQLISATCSNNNNPGAITLAAGDTVTCTFTNKKYPQVTATCVTIVAVQGVPITPVQMTASGGAGGPYTFTATGLPSGLVMDLDGTIHGTPLVSGTFNYTVTVKDKLGNIGTVNCSVTVSPQPLTVSCPTGTTATVGTPYTGQVPVSGGTPPYTFSVSSGALPPGLSLNTSTGAITGTPTTAGTFSFTIKVVDSLGQVAFSQCTSNCTSVTSTWDFSSPLGVLGTSQTYTVNGLTVTAYGFTNGGAATKLYGKQDGGDENGVGLSFYGNTDHEIDTTHFVQLDLQNVISSGATSAQMKVGSVQSGESYNIYGSNSLGTIGTKLAGPLTADDTYFDVPNYGSYRYVSVRAASKDVLLEVLSAVLPPGCTIVVNPNQLHLSCPNGSGKVGAPYSSAVVASGGTVPYTYSIVSGSLPPGLKLNTATGAITGTPTKSGTYTFTTKVTDGNGQTTTKQCKIVIKDCPKPLIVTCPSLKNGKVGSRFSTTVPVSGGTAPYTFSISSGSLPPGLSLDAATGVISGTPTNSGTFSFTVKVIDADGQVAYSACDQCDKVDEKFDFLKECGSFRHSHHYKNDGIDLDLHGFNKDGSWRNLKCRGNGDDDDGVGLSGNYDDGIDKDSFVQVDLSNMISAGATDVEVSVGSAHYGETYNVYGSDRLGETGTLLMKDVKGDGGSVHVPGFPNHKYICIKANRKCVHLKWVKCSNPCQCTITIAPKGCTYTQGGWGSKPSGNNPGALLQNNWRTVYGYGNVKVGGWNTATFTSSTAIQNYLPAGGSPSPLWQSYYNPTSAYSVFHGQVLALQLNVDFSNKGITATGLAGMHVQSGPLKGWTVQQVLTLANQVLGGNFSNLPRGMSVSDLNGVVDSINGAFDGGTTDTGYLDN